MQYLIAVECMKILFLFFFLSFLVFGWDIFFFFCPHLLPYHVSSIISVNARSLIGAHYKNSWDMRERELALSDTFHFLINQIYRQTCVYMYTIERDVGGRRYDLSFFIRPSSFHPLVTPINLFFSVNIILSYIFLNAIQKKAQGKLY